MGPDDYDGVGRRIASPDGHTHRHSCTHTDTDGHSYTHRDGDSYASGYRYSHSWTHTDTNFYTNGDADLHQRDVDHDPEFGSGDAVSLGD